MSAQNVATTPTIIDMHKAGWPPDLVLREALYRMRQQGAPAFNDAQSCLYFDRSTGRKCAVGALLPEGLGNIEDFIGSVDALINCYCWSMGNEELANALEHYQYELALAQMFHDTTCDHGTDEEQGCDPETIRELAERSKLTAHMIEALWDRMRRAFWQEHPHLR